MPIAASCQLDKDTTEAILNSFARAVADLIELGKSLEITIGVITIKIVNRNLTYAYRSNFEQQMNDT